MDFRHMMRTKEIDFTDAGWKDRVLLLERYLQSRNVNESDARMIAHIYAKNKNLWVDTMLVESFGGFERQLNVGKILMRGFLSYLLMGIIPFLPQMIGSMVDKEWDVQIPYIISLGVTVLLVGLLSYLKSLFMRITFWFPVTENLLLTFIASAMGLLAGVFLKNMITLCF